MVESVWPPLREHLVVARPASAGMIAPELPGYVVERLWRPVGSARFGWAADGVWLDVGDEVVVYRRRRGNAADIVAINAMFSATYYDGTAGLWPDEEELLEAEVPARGARVLEICCGAGRLTPPLIRDGNRVVGVDLVAACLAVAPRDRGVTWVRADARALPFADGAFDLVVCLENSLGVIFGEEARVVGELARVCRPGGRLLLGLRSVAGSSGTIERYCSRDGYVELSWVFPLAQTVRGLLQMARVLGLRVLPRPAAHGPRPWGGEVGYWALGRG